MGSSRVVRLTCCALIGLGSLAAQPPTPAVRIITPADIQWTAIPGYPPGYARMTLEGTLDGTGSHTYRVRLPAGFKIEPHTHAADEHVTVLQGAWGLGLGESFDASRVKAIPAGSFVTVPAGTPHFLSIETETIVQVQGIGRIGMTYVHATGPPR
jgi:quercetin dioxygenase-like cupin family protein